MAKSNFRKFKAFFQDKDGHTVLWQSPNPLLYGWIVFKIVGMIVTKGRLRSGSEHLSTAFIFAWSYFEVTKGASSFRRLLGLVIMAMVVISFFR